MQSGTTGAHDAGALVVTFYDALGRRDWATMAAAYAPDARFCDPAFGELDGVQAGLMWRMLAQGARDLAVSTRDLGASADRATVTWTATYTFSATGRRVVNVIDATFRLREGRIVEHVDRFDYWRWSRQALGPVGWLLGWTPLLRRATRRKARARLDAFAAEIAAGAQPGS